jgi:DNA polymerase-1
VKEHEGYYIPVANDRDGKDGAHYILNLFKPLFEQDNITWIGQNLKYDFLVLKWYGIELRGKTFDTMLAHYVIEPEGRRSMDLLSAQFLGYEPVSIETLIGKKGKNQGTMRDVALDQITEYAAEDADITLQLKNCFAPLIEKRAVSKVFEEVENPLVRVLVDMEFEGVKVDTNFLSDYSSWKRDLFFSFGFDAAFAFLSAIFARNLSSSAKNCLIITMIKIETKVEMK